MENEVIQVDNQKPLKFSGLLIIVILVLIYYFLKLLFNIATEGYAIINTLTQSTSYDKVSMIGIIILLLCKIIIIALLSVVLFYFFRKNMNLPSLMIKFLIINFILNTISSLVISYILGYLRNFPILLFIDLIPNLFILIIGILYFAKSKRVKSTFIR